MKVQTLLPIAALLAITFISCKNDAAKTETTDAMSAPAADNAGAQPDANIPMFDPASPAPAGTTTTTPPATKPTEPPQNAAGVWHYTCPKGCAGGGGAIAPCAKCSTPLAHNAAYHGQPNPTAATPTPTPANGQPAAQTTTPPPVKNEPPQNAAGVWHYTCTAGCAGGSGSAIACATCGKKLEHNKSYHGQ